ncbi:malonate--CoA ligase [Tanacetum coccineum]
MEVVEAIASHGSASHERVALIADDKSYGYKHLASSASGISLLLLRHHEIVVYRTMYNKNLDGARIGVVAKPSAEFVASVLAIWLSGGVAVPLETSNPKDGLLHVITNAGVSMILSTVDHSELMREIARKSGAGFSLIPDVLISDVNDDVHSKEIQFSDQVDGVYSFYQK